MQPLNQINKDEIEKVERYLFEQYGRSFLPLEIVAQDFFPYSQEVAKRKAASQELPVAVTRDPSSQKNPHIIYIADLAEYLVRIRDQSKTDWKEINAWN